MRDNLYLYEASNKDIDEGYTAIGEFFERDDVQEGIAEECLSIMKGYGLLDEEEDEIEEGSDELGLNVSTTTEPDVQTWETPPSDIFLSSPLWELNTRRVLVPRVFSSNPL